MTTTKIPDSLFDPSLTPGNAREKGYKYIDDIFYDFFNKNESIKDIIVFLHEFDGKLGASANINMDSYFGLYLPLKNV